MGTFTGDMLRLLAAGAMNTATNTIGNLITLPLKEKAEARQLGLKELLKATGTAPESAMPALAETINRLSRGTINLPTYEGKPGVVGPGGERYNVTPIGNLPTGYMSAPERLYARIPASLYETLGARAQANPAVADAILGVKGGEIQRLTEERKAEQQNWSQQFQEYKQGVTEQLNAARHGERMAQLGQGMAALDLKRQQFEMARGDKAQTEAEKAADKAMGKLRGIGDLITKAKDDLPLQLGYVDQYNEALRNFKKLHPDYFKELPEIPTYTEQPGTIGGFFGAKPKRKIGQSPEGLSAASTGEKTPLRSGIVQSGPNKGKKVTEWSDGSRTYE